MQKGDWALVTGASSGIGKAFAERLAFRGVNLLLVALEENILAELSKQWENRYQIKTAYFGLDLALPASIEKINREVEDKNLNVDVLVNAAGFGYFGDFCNMPLEGIRRMIDVDITSLVLLCRLFLPKMKLRRKGVLINVASISGFLPYPFAAVYSAAKSFVHRFTKALWAENCEKNITIISLCPGYTQTNFEKISNEPSGIHLFPGEDPYEIADKTLRSISGNHCTVFTNITHPLKIWFARSLPPKIFARLLRHLSGIRK